MLDRYDGSYVLAAAAYNAGPGRVERVDRELRRPARARGRRRSIWIETIPFTETRNYVMRVLEGLHVYRARLRGRAEPLRLASDIDRATYRMTKSASSAPVSVPELSPSPAAPPPARTAP